MKYKIIIAALLSIFLYVNIIDTIAHDYHTTSMRYIDDAIFEASHDKHKADSLYKLYELYKTKRDNTRKLILIH